MRFLEMDSNGPDGVAAQGLLHLQGAAGVGVNAPGPTGDAPAPQPPPGCQTMAPSLSRWNRRWPQERSQTSRSRPAPSGQAVLIQHVISSTGRVPPLPSPASPISGQKSSAGTALPSPSHWDATKGVNELRKLHAPAPEAGVSSCASYCSGPSPQHKQRRRRRRR